jgi:hypothetical protein
VTLDSRLTWKEDVDAKLRKTQNFLWACRRAYFGAWVLTPKVMHWLYVSVVRPSVTYASLVWWPGCQTARAMNKLSRTQRLACLGITGVMHTTPTSALEVLLCLTPLHLVVQKEARSAAHRLWDLGCWSYLYPNRGHCSILIRLQQSDPIFNMGVNTMRPAFNLEPKYGVTLLTREVWTKGTSVPSGSSDSQMGPGRVGEPELQSMGSLSAEGSVFPWAGT